MNVENYRVICVLSCIGSIFTSILNTRLYNFLKVHDLPESEEAGFRKKPTSLSTIFFAMHCLIDIYVKHKKRLVCTFVDYKAFDNEQRSILYEKNCLAVALMVNY